MGEGALGIRQRALSGTNRQKQRLKRNFSVLGNNLIENDSQPRLWGLFAVDLRFSNVSQQFRIVPNHDFSVGQNVGNQHGRDRITDFGFFCVNGFCQFGVEDGAFFQRDWRLHWRCTGMQTRAGSC